MDSTKEIFKLNKSVITFKIRKEDLNQSKNPISISEDEIIIENLTQDYLCFKTQTNKKKIYAVDPSYCIIDPKSSKKLIITLYDIMGQELDPIKHKFKFEGFIIQEKEKDIDAKILFSNYHSNSIKVIGNLQIRNVKYIFEQDKINDETTNNDSKIENIKKEEIKDNKQNLYDNKEQHLKENNDDNINKKNNEKDVKKQKENKYEANKINYMVIFGIFTFLIIITLYLLR